MENIFYANSNQKADGLAILSDKVDFNIFKKVSRDKEGHYIKVSITPTNIHAPNNRAPKI